MVERNARYFRCRYDTHHPPNLMRECSHFLVGDKARTRPVLKLAKRQDNLELSYLCSTFVLLMEWQERKTRTRARQGKARKSGVVTTPRHGKFTCCGIVNYHNPTAMKYHSQGKSVYNLEMHDLQFGIVIPLSYLCSVEIRTKSNQNE